MQISKAVLDLNPDLIGGLAKQQSKLSTAEVLAAYKAKLLTKSEAKKLLDIHTVADPFEEWCQEYGIEE